MKRFPSLKDFIYWIIGLTILLIYFMTLKLTKNSEVVDYISFGGTLISIVLAIIAIIYAYQQGRQSSDSYSETKALLSVIAEHVKGIGQLKTEIAISNEGIKDVKTLTSKISKDIIFTNKESEKFDELLESTVGELKNTLDFHVVTVPVEYDFKNPKKIDIDKNLNKYLDHYGKISGDKRFIAFNVEESISQFGFSFSIGTSDRSMTPNRMKAILETTDNNELKIFTVARLIYAD
ncbi:hypothetical protein [Bacillus wiedmannii]|uniref:hypothetical protein n=1 Tax=Bacillus wiedmannii TaxID=1890302 RepID=UPI0034675FEC